MPEVCKSYLEMRSDEIRRKFLHPLTVDIMESHAFDEESRHRPDGPFQRDYARIMYSSSFRRLQGKMQLLGIKQDQFFRNRLTHSLEVAQIARSIAGTIQYEPGESYIVEAGALAHDLGNPPFGHAGERCLNKLFADIGGFEGNAQTLRILTNVEKKRPDFRGLNLTYRTLLAVVKYFKRFDFDQYKKNPEVGQKFIYDDDYALLNKIVQENTIQLRTLDVQIVDISDEIAYAAHDLEDGLRLKAYTIDEILHDYEAQYGNGDCCKKLEEIVANARVKAGYGTTAIDSSQYSKLFRQELVSSLINLALNDIDLIQVENAPKTGTTQSKELGFHSFGNLIHGLKNIVFKCINHNDEVYHYEQEGKKVLEFLKSFYSNDVMYLPPEYRAKDLARQYKDLSDIDQDKLQERLICDYLAGMMDSYAVSVYEKFSGVKFSG